MKKISNNEWESFDIPDEIEAPVSSKLCASNLFSMANNILQSNKGSVKSEDKEAFNISERSYNSVQLVPNLKEKELVQSQRKSKFVRKCRNNKKSKIIKRNTITQNVVIIASRSKLRERSDSVSLYSSNSPEFNFNNSISSLIIKDNRIRISSQQYQKYNDSLKGLSRMVTMRDVMGQDEAN